MINFDNDPRLADMNPIKIKIIKEISNSTSGKSMEQVLPDIMRVNQELQKRNLAFSKQESELLMDIMMETMPPQDRKMVAIIKSML